MSVEAQDTRFGQTLGKRFLVRRVIGVGGMGVVYEVEHVVTKKLGALKLLHGSLAAQTRVVERFVREASAAARIGNRHIVETYDAGELPSGEPYMFMELLDGRSLRDLLHARGRLSFAEAREILLQAADGLAAAHAAGIVHRDIKPENLFITSGSPAYVKILDFGISKFSAHSDHRLTTAGAPMGTPFYMAPEQVVGKTDLDERCDVYALGVVLYECVTGSVPFDAPSLPALSIKIFEGRYTPPRDIQRDAPDGLDELVARAMAVEPSTRYQTMNEFKAALERFAATPISLSTTLASAEGLPTAQQGGPAGASQQRTVPLASESSPPDAPRVATSSPPHTRTTGGVSAATEPKAPGRGRRALVVGIGVAVAAGVAIALGSTKAPPTVTPDDEEAARRSADRSPAAPSPPPVPAPAPLVSSELSAPTASAVVDAGATVPPVPSAIDASRPRAPKPRPSASSRAARDGLTEENPF